MTRPMLFIASAIIFICLASISSASIGVSPGYYNIDYKPGLKANVYFDFSEDKEIPLEIYVEGDLAEYVKLSTDRLKGSGSVAVSINLPDAISTPGTHVIYVGARQVPEEGQGLGIVGSIKGSIRIIVPYPGQYSTIRIEPTNANIGENVNLTVTIDNLGAESVDASARADVYSNDTYISAVDLGSFHLSSPEQKVISTSLIARSYPAGIYQIRGNLDYGDGKSASHNSSFRIGELEVRITNHSNFLARDKINRFDLEVTSDWNGVIDGVYANVTLEGYPISFLTPTTSINNFGSATLTGFFDTSGIQNSSFNALIRVHYAGKSTEQIVALRIEESKDYLLMWLIAAVVIVAMMIALTTYLLRKNEKRKK